MKRKMALALSIIMLATVCISSFVYASDGMSLEEAIKFARSVLEISEEYEEFNYGTNNYSGTKTWDFSWQKNDLYGSGVDVRVDDSGDILWYYNYNFKDYKSGKRIPNISKGEAQIIAEEFIKKLNSPELFNSLKLIERDQSIERNSAYLFYYISTYDGVPVPFNNINISVDYGTGKILIYEKSWTKDVNFPKSDDAISMKEAQKVYKEELGLRLTYNLGGDKVYLAYTPICGSEYVIDAISGESTNLMLGVSHNDLVGGFGKEEGTVDSAEKSREVVLSPEEIKTIKESYVLISQEEAENIVREFDMFEMDDSFKLKFSNLRREWGTEKNYIWSMSFSKEQIEESEKYQYISVSLNAKTGEIINFDIDYPREEGSSKYSEEQAKVIVEEFLEKMQPEKFKNTEYDNLYKNNIMPAREKENSYYSFKYTRMVNDIPFVSNSFIIRFDGIKGKICGFNMDWQELEFPAAENILSLDKIYDLFFEKIGLNLEYRNTNLYSMYFVENSVSSEVGRAVPDIAVEAPDAVSDIAGVVSDTSDTVFEASKVALDMAIEASDAISDTAVGADGIVSEGLDKYVSLVYVVDSKKPLILDAFTGKLLDVDGEEYIEKTPIEYTDISEHYAKKQIETLAEMGIGLEGPTFKPNEKIKQKDFLLLISQIIDRGYAFYNKTALEDDLEIEKLYSLLIMEGIVQEGEENPEALLTREESVKFVMRALKYDKIADLKDIFKCDFLDKEEIDSNLVGYVVLAKGFNIVNGYGDYFRPKEELKRADAIIIIYNYLKI